MEIEQNGSTEAEQTQEHFILEQQPNNVAQLFQSQHYKLALSGFSAPILSILINNYDLHQQLLDIMLLKEQRNPPVMNQEIIDQFKRKNLPFKCHQLLLSLGDAYGSYMLGYNGHTLLQINGISLVKRMFQVFETKNSLNETAIGYLYKLIDMVLARTDSTPLLFFFQNNRSILDNVIYHFQSFLAVDIFFKSFETHYEGISVQQKILLVKQAITSIVKQLENKSKQCSNLISGLRYLCQKILDKTNIRKVGTSKITEYILGQQMINMLENILRNSELSCEVYSGCIQIYNLLLKQCKSNQQPKSSTLTKNKYFGKCLSKVKIQKLSTQLVSKILTLYHFIFCERILPLNLLNYQKNKKWQFFQFLQSLELISKYYPQQLQPYLLSTFLQSWLIQILINHPFSSLYHSAVKEILLVSIQYDNPRKQLLSSKQLCFLKFITSSFLDSNCHGYISVLFLIIERILIYCEDNQLFQYVNLFHLDDLWNKTIEKHQKIRQIQQRVYQQDQQYQMLTSGDQHIINNNKQYNIEIMSQIYEINLKEKEDMVGINQNNNKSLPLIKQNYFQYKKQYNSDTKTVIEQNISQVNGSFGIQQQDTLLKAQTMQTINLLNKNNLKYEQNLESGIEIKQKQF